MLFLLGNIIFGATFMLAIKLAYVRDREDIFTIGALNYIVAAVAISPEFFSASESTVTPNGIGTGVMMGSAYFIAYFFVIFVVRYNGAAAAAVVSAMSLLVPIFFGVYYWHETPNRYQVLGICASLIALLLMSRSKQNAKPSIDIADGVRVENDRDERSPAAPTQSARRWLGPVMLLSFYALCGLSRLAQEAFKHLCEETQRPTFILFAFGTAAIPSVIMLIVRRKRISITEWAFGLFMGLANVLQIHFILKALDQFDGFIVFPATGVGGLLLTAIVASGLLGESLSKSSILGIAIACGALVLLNWT